MNIFLFSFNPIMLKLLLYVINFTSHESKQINKKLIKVGTRVTIIG